VEVPHDAFIVDRRTKPGALAQSVEGDLVRSTTITASPARRRYTRPPVLTTRDESDPEARTEGRGITVRRAVVTTSLAYKPATLAELPGALPGAVSTSRHRSPIGMVGHVTCPSRPDDPVKAATLLDRQPLAPYA